MKQMNFKLPKQNYASVQFNINCGDSLLGIWGEIETPIIIPPEA